jgi:hypothetical protein
MTDVIPSLRSPGRVTRVVSWLAFVLLVMAPPAIVLFRLLPRLTAGGPGHSTLGPYVIATAFGLWFAWFIVLTPVAGALGPHFSRTPTPEGCVPPLVASGLLMTQAAYRFLFWVQAMEGDSLRDALRLYLTAAAGIVMAGLGVMALILGLDESIDLFFGSPEGDAGLAASFNRGERA